MTTSPSLRLLDASTIGMINRAYATATSVLAIRPSLFHGMSPSDARANLGRAMIELVETGTTDEATLARDALLRAFPACRSRPGIMADRQTSPVPDLPLHRDGSSAACRVEENRPSWRD